MPLARSGFASRMMVFLLLLLAAAHCTRSIFADNVSLVDLPNYARGIERNPFQGRMAMMPVLRWAGRSHGMARAAGFFDASLTQTPHFAVPPEHVTAEKLACVGVGFLAVLLMVGCAVWVGQRRMPEGLWWLPACLTLGMLYVTYASRYEAQFWYPYDLPHFALFGLASVLLLEDYWLAAALVFAVDVPMRETSIFLVPVLLALGYTRKRLNAAGLYAISMCVFWLAVRGSITYRFWGNPNDVAVRWIGMARAIANPLHWPQVASAFGFLLIPLWLNRRLLKPDEQALLLSAIPGVLAATLFGIWYETRIYDEWILASSVLLAAEFAAYVRLVPELGKSIFPNEGLARE